MHPPEGPQDEPSILDGWTLLRRISHKWVVPEGAERRVSTQAFQDLKDADNVEAMSAYVEERLTQDELDADAVIEGLEEYGYVAIPVALIRELGLRVTWAPREDDGPRGSAHAHVFGKKTGSVRNRLADGCTCRRWPVPPEA